MIRSAFLFTAVALAATMTASAQAATTVRTECQKNLEDGRILAVDGRVLPDDATFKVVSYRAERQEDGWSYGPCVLKVTPGGAR